MMTSNFMVRFERSDGLSMTSVYEESCEDIGVFSTILGIQDDNIFSFMDEEMLDRMNDIMEESYDRHDVDYLPTRWGTVDGDEREAKLFMYSFFQRMGRDPVVDENFTGVYSSIIKAWDMPQMSYMY